MRKILGLMIAVFLVSILPLTLGCGEQKAPPKPAKPAVEKPAEPAVEKPAESAVEKPQTSEPEKK